MNEQPTALRIAEALEYKWWRWKDNPTIELEAATELRRLHTENEALRAQFQQQEPVPYHIVNNDRIRVDPFTGSVSIGSPEQIQPVSTTHSQQRQPLTDEQIRKIRFDTITELVTMEESELRFARAIEAAHGIKENT